MTTLAVGWAAWRRREQSSMREHAAFALILAGAIGNTLDRVRRGYVVDFAYVHHWPIFNVADVLVVVGAGLLVWGSFRRVRLPEL